MNKIIAAVVIVFGTGFLGMGALFMIAGGTENLMAGGVMILIGLGMFGFVAYSKKAESNRPQVVQQEFHIQMGGSGEFKTQELKCKSCGGPIKDEDVKVVDGGLAIKCPHCGKLSVMQEQPKW